jgi:hypothetical protein
MLLAVGAGVAGVVQFDGEEMSLYDATQKQRYIERGIRHWKRQAEALQAAGMDNSAEIAKVREWQARMRDFTKQTGLSRQSSRETTLNVVSDLDKKYVLARKGQLFSLQSRKTDIIQETPIDLSKLYSNERIKADRIIFPEQQKSHVLLTHPDDEMWMQKHQKYILDAINSPSIIDMEPRNIRRNILTVANIISMGDDDFLNVVVSFHKGTPEDARIWTAFRIKREYLFETTGELKKRWMKVK